MKRIILLIILPFTINAIAQDGSDIKYVSVSDLDNSYVGKMAHLDFYKRSFGGLKFDNKDLTDKVTIELDNKKIEFLEHRVDNGHNNWFSEQYLESTEFIDGNKIQISMCKIEEIKSDSIKVILFLEYRDKNGKLNSEKPNTIEYEFPKKILAEVLVRN
ncbi:hypothetical protein Q4566_16180 [Tamlana sp. 2_MG-2023]|uniref:hypothetical protein n=1 Tax=unclassified Tamlana TaxID=2614803 RepID=UPI0026E253E4|nr:MULTISPECIES: hypothetical protein [unclassified Tamlana]MDO6761747.1 hypothetical protein [Tamlana sp. 2_MG-2023]MDO6792508.1 hypothetical protein [Tamlana sp. 1_MG-2023]